MDSTGALELADVPERLLVIGGGIIGLEMATVYDALGSKVTVVELLDQLIPGADPDLVRPLQQAHREALRGDPPRSTKVDRGGGRATTGSTRHVRGRRRAGAETFDRDPASPSGAGRTASRSAPSTAGVDGRRARLHRRRRAAAHQRAAHLRHRRRRRRADARPQGDARGQGRGRGDRRARTWPSTPRAIPSVAYTDPEVAWIGPDRDAGQGGGHRVREGGRSRGRRPAARSRMGRDEGADQAALRARDASGCWAPASSASTRAS